MLTISVSLKKPENCGETRMALATGQEYFKSKQTKMLYFLRKKRLHHTVPQQQGTKLQWKNYKRMKKKEREKR